MMDSMDVSLFLAKLLGLYFLITAVICIFRRKQIKATGKEFASSPAILAVSAEISLLFGLVIAIDHTVWEPNWRGVVTALGYLMILRGICRFGFPAHARKVIQSKLEKAYPLVCLVMLVLGVYLTYNGFTYQA